MWVMLKEVVNSPISDNILATFQGLPSLSPPPTREAQAEAAAHAAHTAHTAGERRPQPMQSHRGNGREGAHNGRSPASPATVGIQSNLRDYNCVLYKSTNLCLDTSQCYMVI